MAEISNDKADIIIALLAQLVAANVEGDPVLVLTKTGMKQKDVAKLLGLKANAVGMRIKRAGTKPRGKTNANQK